MFILIIQVSYSYTLFLIIMSIFTFSIEKLPDVPTK